MLKGVSWRPIGSTLPLHPSWVFKVPQHFSNSFIIINSFPLWISQLFLSFSQSKENILVPSQNSSSFMPLWRTKELIWRPDEWILSDMQISKPPTLSRIDTAFTLKTYVWDFLGGNSFSIWKTTFSGFLAEECLGLFICHWNL